MNTDCNISYHKELQVKYQTDVLVAGGGPAGVAAAVMCARAQKETGGSVLLLEQSGTFGGSSTLAGVPELMNFDDGRNFLAKGFGELICRSLYGDESVTDSAQFRRFWRNVRTEELKLLYDQLMLESGADFHFYSRIVDVVMDGNAISHVIVSSPEGIYAIRAKMVIDCTGQGAVCVAAGADFAYGDEDGVPMPATLCSLWGGIDFARKPKDNAGLEQAYRDGIFSQYDMILPGIKATYPEVGVGGGNIGHCFGVPDYDTRRMTAAMLRGRQLLKEYETYYRNYLPGCENAVLMDSANYLGIRESRRIKCITTLQMEDYFDQTAKPDEIGRYSYPIDIHPMTPDQQGMQQFDRDVATKHGTGESYSIPYGCLVPAGIRNLLVAGRNIGTDHAMQASARVIPCCYITGQAAGIAAALCAANGCAAAEVDLPQLQKMLLKNQITV